MSGELQIFNRILLLDLRPSVFGRQSDMKFKQLLSELKKEYYAFQPKYEVHFIKPLSYLRKYYTLLIEYESIQFLNHMHKKISEAQNKNEKKYHVNWPLTRTLPEKINELSKVITNRNLNNDNLGNTDEEYIFQLLKHHLFRLFLEIQNSYKDLVKDDILSKNEVYMKFFNEQILKISYIIENEIIPDSIEETKTKYEKKLTFGYNQTSTDILKNICKSLILKIDFINEDLTTEHDFITVMTSKDLSAIDKQIHIGCETRQFRYVVDKLKQYFSSFTLSNIDKSNLFYSKNGNKITASNLSRNKIDIPKEKETIDRIFKEMQ